MTYGAIAALIPPPKGTDWAGYRRIRARWVGYAMTDCPSDVPWHRVVNALGRISGRHGLGPDLQRELLMQEGITFDRSDRVQLKPLLWEPEAEWLLQHGLLQPQF
jgi:alkylated DNA nucleotide flippase Atl1